MTAGPGIACARGWRYVHPRTGKEQGMLRIRQAEAAGAMLAAVVATAPSPALAQADAQADFYKGRTIELIVSTGVGGGLDANARVVARHLVNHIPGAPTIVVKNMPGAGHIRAANYVFTQAAKDGSTIATFIPVFVMAQVGGA